MRYVILYSPRDKGNVEGTNQTILVKLAKIINQNNECDKPF